MDLSKCVEKIITLCEDMDIEDLAEPEQVFVYFDDAYTLFKQSSEYVELEKKIRKIMFEKAMRKTMGDPLYHALLESDDDNTEVSSTTS